MRIRETFSSLKIRNFRLYVIGQAVSLCGTWMQTIGQDWLVLKMTGSGTQLGFVSAMQFLPILLFGPWGGVIVDRFEKRKLLYATQTAAGVLALILGGLVIANAVQLWMIYGLAFALGMVNVVDNPARQTFVPEMVGREALPNAVALNSTEVNLARAVGPALAAAVIATAGLGTCFIFNSISYVPVIVMLRALRKNELSPAPRETSRPELRAGIRYARSSPALWYPLVMMAIIGTFTYEFSVSLPLLARFALGGGAGAYAALVAATGFGSIVGGLFTASRRKVGLADVVISAFGFGVTFSAAAFMPNLATACVVLFFAGIVSIQFISFTTIILQLESEPRMRGRVMALWNMAFLGSTPVGGPVIGWIGEVAGPRAGVLVGGLAALAAGGIGWLAMRRRQNHVL